MKSLNEMTRDELRDQLAAIYEREYRLKLQGRTADLIADHNLYNQLIDELALRGIYSTEPEPLPFDEAHWKWGFNFPTTVDQDLDDIDWRLDGTVWTTYIRAYIKGLETELDSLRMKIASDNPSSQG